MASLNARLWHTRNQSVPNMSCPERMYDINIRNHQVQYRTDQQNRYKEPDICHARIAMRRKIMEILFPSPKPHDRDQIVGLVKILEEILFKEAASEEEFVNQETLKHRLQQLTNRLCKNPYSSDSSPNGASRTRLDVHGSERAYIDEAAMPYKRTMSYGPSVDPLKCYQRDLNQQSHRHQMQGEKKMAGDTGKILMYQGFLDAYVRYKIDSQDGVTNLSLFSKMKFIVSHIRTCKEKKCRCGEYSRLLKHYHNCQDRRCPICEPVRNDFHPRKFDPGVQKPIIGTRLSHNDQDYTHTIDHSEETWPPLKRHKIENPCPTGFAANETPEVWAPITESGFTQGIQLNYQKLDGYPSVHSEYTKPEVMKVSLDSHTQNTSFFTEFIRCNEDDGVPIDLSNPQGFPKIHQQLYGPLHAVPEFGEYEVIDASTDPFQGIAQDIPNDATEIRHHDHVMTDQPCSFQGLLQMDHLYGPLSADSKHAEAKGMEVSLDHVVQDTSTVTETGYNELVCSPDDVSRTPEGLPRCHQQLGGPSYVNTEHVESEVKKVNLDFSASQAQDNLNTAARGNNQELDDSRSPQKLHQVNQQDNKQGFDSEYVEPDVLEARMDYLASLGPGVSNGTGIIKDHTELDGADFVGEAGTQEDIDGETIFNPINPEVKYDHVSAAAGEGTKSVNSELKGVSLIESFTPEQIKKHIASLRQWVGQSKGKVEKNQARAHLVNEDSCQLCSVEHLSFQPLIYCSLCGVSIKKKISYYASLGGDVRYLFCQSCYKKAQGESITVYGNHINKARLEKKRNEETVEPWVQCDKCDGWQHQICALFNEKRNEEDRTEYICPNCYVEKVNSGGCRPLHASAIPGAKDLPRTMLSDFIEERLFTRLKAEREERAVTMGKSYNEVPGAEDLVVRVVLSANKKLQVKKYIRDALQEENYPSEFPYKLKVILLFQKIEGVEVCLLGMYTQEFGSECAYPNQRFVSVSYLDSVKYFRPETKTVTGEALRTFVYHEILIGYLDYCKRRGFSRCYIWSCPPKKADNYILYCHPEIQKIPKPEELRKWYQAMLKKASSENIVVEVTNLYDLFFVPHGDCKVTAARLPYFDGDYWPGIAENMLKCLEKEDGEKLRRKGKSRRALEETACPDHSGKFGKAVLLMQKLGKSIWAGKEHFIFVNLVFTCTHCFQVIVSGRWSCNICKSFHLCERCHDVEKRRDKRENHHVTCKENHPLCQVEVSDIPAETEDKDEIMENDIFDTRETFLRFCATNFYQFDTLRRAKHSSMMLLFHLHNPEVPAFVTS